ncbi:ComF family protein [Fructobacillus pseudoficulneus]|uniref:ComF family protein n=1 Tax=Fructobacillus pseudoficulneus TaxID=220714 RepID=A0A3F3H9K5_9LACO|nr:ComF family protein [Fructobacillus pseudoficulneus]GAP03169.1 ComF family protein [Fructobacillus pseudoficulneus]SEH40882.1 competence protein ComFC [Fructobacillus pseudoficulneus]
MNCLLCQEFLAQQSSALSLLTGRQAGSDLVCSRCLSQFTPITRVICYDCGRDSLPNEETIDKMSDNETKPGQQLCHDCQRWQAMGQSSLRHQALYRYDEQMKEYMSRYKFIGDYRLHLVFQKEMRQAIRRLIKQERIDWVVPIPLTQSRLAKRGFNQVEPFLSGKVLAGLVTKEQQKVEQSSLDRKKRMEGEQPFKLAAGVGPNIVNRTILLVDDIYTTGRTLHYAASCLYQAGAAQVFSISLAR